MTIELSNSTEYNARVIKYDLEVEDVKIGDEKIEDEKVEDEPPGASDSEDDSDEEEAASLEEKMNLIRKDCNEFEERLLDAVVKPAVAKETAPCVLQVSSADFMSKWIGEDEKLVRAVFTLGRKLDPCVIFIDKADAVFRKQWDGVNNNSKGGFVMVATNRPGDLDPGNFREVAETDAMWIFHQTRTERQF
ncbi:hypothetical protein DL769_006256 [Monosporascus sp. CRB-8-3]|nr:hypothetical protein DL769_006256 [Monosporascus sp. CRB-8-3]